jgi:hypothetical protein
VTLQAVVKAESGSFIVAVATVSVRNFIFLVSFFSADFTAAFFCALDFFTLAALCFFSFGADAARPRVEAVGVAGFQSSQLPT